MLLQGSSEYISTVVISSILAYEELSVLEMLVVEAGDVVDVALVGVGDIVALLLFFFR